MLLSWRAARESERPMAKITAEVRRYLQEITRKGGQSKSPSKVAASRKNGRNGGRPRLYPKCPRYGHHRFSNGKNWCPCGFLRPKP